MPRGRYAAGVVRLGHGQDAVSGRRQLTKPHLRYYPGQQFVDAVVEEGGDFDELAASLGGQPHPV